MADALAATDPSAALAGERKPSDGDGHASGAEAVGAGIELTSPAFLHTREQKNDEAANAAGSFDTAKVGQPHVGDSEDLDASVLQCMLGIDKAVPRVKPLASQASVDSRRRSLLVDWLVEAHEKYKSTQETLYLTVAVMDQYLASTSNITLIELPLVALVAYMVASKYEEIYPPSLSDFVFMGSRAFTRTQIVNVELKVLHALQYRIPRVTAQTFMGSFIKCMQIADARYIFLVRFYCERMLQEDGMQSVFSAATVAHAAAIVANVSFLQKTLPSPCNATPGFCTRKEGCVCAVDTPQTWWPKQLAQLTGHTPTAVYPCLVTMCTVLNDASKTELQAVVKKYSSIKHMCVAAVFASVHPARVPLLVELAADNAY